MARTLVASDGPYGFTILAIDFPRADFLPFIICNSNESDKLPLIVAGC